VSDHATAIEARIPASLEGAIGAKLALAAQDDVERRVRAEDATLWAPAGTAEVANRLGWLTIAERMRGDVEALESFAAQAAADGIADVVLLGMGGSSLAPEVLRRCFEGIGGKLRLHVLDSTDAATVGAVQSAIDPQQTLFLVSSKSGGTIEPLSLFAHFFALNQNGRNFAAITDPGSGLADLAAKHGFRETFDGDPNIGGRYSALSAFGIVPATLMGVDTGALLDGAAGAWETAAEQHAEPAGIWLGAALSALAQAGRDKLTFLIDPSLPGLGLWLEQLVAESTGKHGTGILPVAEEPAGEPQEYGPDRVFAWIADLDDGGDGKDAARARADSYARAGHPVVTVPAHGAGDLGRIFLLWEIAVAVAGWGLQINPFDQPNVQQAKDATNRVLAQFEADGELPGVETLDAHDDPHGKLAALLGEAAPPDYVAIMGYVQPSEAFDEAIAELRSAIRAATKATTTFGYGPRFLHSTGQFHKGGPRTGRFLQLLHDGPDDEDIPRAPYTFTTLKNAQAIGDFTTLRELGLPAERVRLQGPDAASALRELTTRIKEMLT
jgi:glucose-6-phosphate isomerase